MYNESIDKFNKVEEEMFKKLVDECAKYNDVLWLDEFVNLEVPLVESYLSEDEKENYIYSIQKVVDSEYETDFVEYIDINLDINKKKILNAVLSFIMNGYIF